MGTEDNADRIVKVRGLLFDANGLLKVTSSGGGGGGGAVDQGQKGVEYWLTELATLDPGLVALTVNLMGAPSGTLEAIRALLDAPLDVTGGLTDAELRASPPEVNADPTNRFVGGKTPVCETVTAAGDTDIYTPAAGMAVTLWWVTAITDPDESTTPLVKVSLGALECYRSFALAHWEPFTGAADAPLTVNLSAVSSVAVTAHVTEGPP